MSDYAWKPPEVVDGERARHGARAQPRRRRLPRAARALDGAARAVLGRRRARPRDPVPRRRTSRCSTAPTARPGRAGSRRAPQSRPRLRRALGRRPRRMRDVEAIAWEDEAGATRSLSYAELAREVARFAEGLEALGVGSGDAVALLMPMIPEVAIALLRRPPRSARSSCRSSPGSRPRPWRAGSRTRAPWRSSRWTPSCGAAAPCRPRRRPTRRSRARPACARRWWCATPASRSPGTRAATCGGTSSSRAGRERGGRRPSRASTRSCSRYTSGTTGRPKGAVHVHGGFLVKIASEGRYTADFQPGDRIHWMTDIGWIMGPWLLANAHGLGLTALLYDGAPDFPDAGRIWRLAERHRLTFLGVSPTLVRALRQAGDELARRRRPLGAAAVRLDRRAVEPGALAVAVRARRRRDAADHEHLRRHRGRCRLPRLTALPAAQAVHARACRCWAWRWTCTTPPGSRCAARWASSSARSRGRA